MISRNYNFWTNYSFCDGFKVQGIDFVWIIESIAPGCDQYSVSLLSKLLEKLVNPANPLASQI